MVNKNEYFKDLSLYQFFVENGTPEQISLINGHIDFCMPLLDSYYKAFPKYTLHNLTHQRNLIRLVGDILGNDLSKLTALEAAFIILSVVYHDLGMVFNDEQIKEIEKEENFQFFLDENLKAKLRYQENNLELSKDLAEWYCRWVHAKRVWLFLKNQNAFKWGTIALNLQIGNICESHNYNAKRLNDDEMFETNFIDQADLRFCAVLLRLADILDFDNSRSPKSVYEFLDLDNPKNINEQISKDEWLKHLCSEGFTIEHNDGNIDIRFKAGPIHPQIEKNIQTFLDVIEDELKGCSVIINKCSKRWRDFKLPLFIDRTNIKSQNYKKGDYRLSLDENQIIKLLAGENLYDDDFVFIRELLQNAIDTSRMREYHEVSNGNSNFKADPIEIKCWIDSNGYRWVRVDDYGMGVNEYVITNHLLKKGNSYYNSDYFRIQKNYFKEKTKKDFTPISRFGIGLLSCFIFGDIIEINSKAVAIPQTKSAEEKIRLSIEGLQSQYYLQTDKDKHIPNEMPNSETNENGYRENFGTSIAIRISRNKDYLRFEESLKLMINVYVTCSPVDILYTNKKVGVNFDQILNTPFSPKRFFPFTTEQKQEISELLQKKIESKIGIEVLPIDLSSSSVVPNLKGQIVFIRLKSQDIDSITGEFEYRFHTHEITNKRLTFTKKYFNEEKKKDEEKEVNISIDNVYTEAFDLDVFNSLFKRTELGDNYYKSGIKIIHNGINVPNFHERYQSQAIPKLDFYQNIFTNVFSASRYNQKHACYGIIYLQDNLIPDLSVARNMIKSLKFSIYSNVFYSTKELNNSISNSRHYYDYIDNILEYFTLKDIKSDELVVLKYWDAEKLIESEIGICSVNELKDELKKREIKISIQRGRIFRTALSRGLIELNFENEYVISDKEGSYIVLKSVVEKLSYSKEFLEYYPLLFMKFEMAEILAHSDFINKTHWLGKWLFRNKEILAEEFEMFFNSLIRYIIEANVNEINSIIKYFKKVLPEEIGSILKDISESDFYQAKI